MLWCLARDTLGTWEKSSWLKGQASSVLCHRTHPAHKLEVESISQTVALFCALCAGKLTVCAGTQELSKEGCSVVVAGRGGVWGFRMPQRLAHCEQGL